MNDLDPALLARVRGPLVRAGLDPQRAALELRRVGLVDLDAQHPLDAIAPLLDGISNAADPTDAMLCLTGLADHDRSLLDEIVADPEWLGRVIAVGGASRPLGDLIARHPEATRGLTSSRPVSVAQVTADVSAALRASDPSPDARAAAITSIRRRNTAHIAARDLTGAATVDEVAAELSALAEGVLTGTLDFLHDERAAGSPAARLSVIGMGKLGGYELNYVSDVDVMFVHEPVDGEDAAAEEAVAVFEQLLALLNASTTMGRAYEIDPTLRPEGRSGALSRTPGSFEAYWERWAKTWEFQALIKARPVAGDVTLGAEFLERASRFVYPPSLDPGVVGEIQRMKGRVEAKPEVLRHGERQVKLGPGGLRDIEFAVQLLQLVHGRADPALRMTGTVAALSALGRGGYVADEDAAAFTDAYRTLREVEHRLQLANERRTHTIPEDAGRQERLARSLGYRPTPDSPARDEFMQDLRGVQGVVRGLHAKLFYRPLLESHAAVPADGVELTRRVLDDDAARERLRALGFRNAAAALRDVRSLTEGVSRSARTLQVVLPAFLYELQNTPDPDTGLQRFRDLVESQNASSEFTSRLRDHPPTLAGLARVFGSSEVAADLLAAQPKGLEWFDVDALSAPASPDNVLDQAIGRLRWQDPMPALRRLKRHLLLRIVLRDLLGDATIGAVADDLVTLADVCLQAGLRAILTDLAIEQGGSRPDDLPLRMVAIGMGKLGGRELHYVSDLDVMFVHEPVAGADRTLVHELANRAAEQLIAGLGAVTAEGTAFEIDADLRPEGRQGPLSRSLESFEHYYERWSEPWEHQALLKARMVAGDDDLGRRFEVLAREWAYPDQFTDADATRMRRMKARLEKERIKKRQDPKRHLKLGPGGLSDVEWTVQLLQKRHGGGNPVLRTTNTLEAIDMLQDESVLDHRDAGWLRDGYRFLSMVRNRMYLMRIRDVDVLPTAGHDLVRLAHSLGYGPTGRQEFEDEHLRHTRHVRRVAEEVFYEMPDATTRGIWERG